VAPDDVVLRPAAGAHEAEVLSALAMRSKAHWGYGHRFLERVRSAVSITPTEVAEDVVMVAEVGGVAVGFHHLVGGPPRTELAHLFVEPAFIGSGVGRLLWDHAVGEARAIGSTALWFEADPNAEGFYRHLGARVTGSVETRPGRRLPVMTLDL
jgi:GNAT superfamily N-acetyltransferase